MDKKIQKNAFQSLNEVELFLRNFKRFCNYIKIYNYFKTFMISHKKDFDSPK